VFYWCHIPARGNYYTEPVFTLDIHKDQPDYFTMH